MASLYQYFDETQEREPFHVTKDGQTFYEGSFMHISVIYNGEDGFINATKICKDFNRAVNRLAANEGWKSIVSTFEQTIAEDGEVATYDLRLGPANNAINGLYVNPKIFHNVLQWANSEYNAQMSLLAMYLSKDIGVRDIPLQDVLEEYRQKYNNAITGRRSIEGDVVIQTKGVNEYHIYARQASSGHLPKHSESLCFYNATTVYNLFKFYVRMNLVDGVVLNRQQVFTGELELIKRTLNDIAKRKFQSNRPFEDIIKMSIIETIQSRHITRTMVNSTCKLLSSEGSKSISSKEFNSYKDKLSAQQLGFLFEIYCAETYNLLPYKYDNTEDMGMNKQDVGCDLMDYDKHIYGQCKYYCNSNIRESTISGFIYFITSIKETGNRFILFVNEDAKIFKPLIDSLEERGIELVRVSNKKFIEWLMNIHDTGSYWAELDSDDSSNQSTASETISENALVIGEDTTNSDKLIEKVTLDVKKRNKPTRLKKGFVTPEHFKETAEAWIKTKGTEQLPNGKYKEPTARLVFGGFDFGRYYHEKCKTGIMGQELQKWLKERFYSPPDMKLLTDSERYQLLEEFYNAHERLPTIDDHIHLPVDHQLYEKAEGLSYKRLYEAATHARSIIRESVREMFNKGQMKCKYDNTLQDAEVITLFRLFEATYKRLPKQDDRFKDYNVYRLWLKIRDGIVRHNIQDKVIAIFKEYMKTDTRIIG